VVGIDVGGTKIAAGAVAGDGETFASHAASTGAEDGSQAVVDRIIGLVQDTAREARASGRHVAGVAIATAGMVDSRTGTVTFATPALPAWAGVDLGERIEKATGLPVRIANDAHAAAWGEWCCGAGRGTHHMVMVTVGTGVGGGVIADGALLRGSHGVAARIGHLTVDGKGHRCWCRGVGCLEAHASGAAIARAARAALDGGADTALRGAGRRPGAVEVLAAARAGDACARGIADEAARCLGAAFATLVNLFDPEVIVVGGGVADGAGELVDAARQHMADRLPPALSRGVSLRRGALAQRAAVAGAALLAWSHFTSSDLPVRGSRT
jgi:glucokinase